MSKEEELRRQINRQTTDLNKYRLRKEQLEEEIKNLERSIENTQLGRELALLELAKVT
jgi:cell division protein FtsB